MIECICFHLHFKMPSHQQIELCSGQKMVQPIRSLIHQPEWLNTLHPQWPKNVRILMSTRLGGYSSGVYASLNLGEHVGDDPLLVLKNRERYQQLTNCQIVYLNQVHDSKVLKLDPSIPHSVKADACVSTFAGLACTIMVADCLPILITNSSGTIVGAAHAGWRGLAGIGCEGGQDVVENLLESLTNLVLKSGSKDLNWLAWLGPCIGPKHFEVGEDVREAFRCDLESSAHFTPCPLEGEKKWKANLVGLAQSKLKQKGVKTILGNEVDIYNDRWCTFSNSELFFSHRRDKTSGRMAASIWMI